MSRFRFSKAATLYKKVADADLGNIPAREKLAQALWMMGDPASAEAVYKTLAENPQASPENKFQYAQVLRINGKYEEAAGAYKTFAATVPGDVRSKLFENFAEEIKQLAQDNKTFELVSIPENTAASDIGPAYGYGGSVIITSNRETSGAFKTLDPWSGKSFYNLYSVSGATSNVAAKPEGIKGKVNKRFNEGPAAFSRDGKEMIFTRSNYKKKSKDGTRKLGLYRAEWHEKKGWTNIRPLMFNSNDYNVAHPALSKDGRFLVFTSDMPGGNGETDLYVSVKEGDIWGTPQNLGSTINTPGREMFPHMADDGTLYFSSDSRSGLGGLDIYYSYMEDRKWTPPYNLGTPVNSRFDDFGYVSDESGKNGYLVSNRPGGLGGDDIYRFTRNAESVCGTVLSAKNSKGVEDVVITATNQAGEKTGIRTNMKGDFCLQLKPGEEYKIEALKEGFTDFAGTITPKVNKNPKQTIMLEPKGEVQLTVDVAKEGGEKVEGATAFVVDKQTGEVMQGKSGADGRVQFDLFKDKEYALKVVKKTGGNEGVYDKFVKTISTMGFTNNMNVSERAELKYYDRSYVFDLPNVYFDLNSFDVKGGAAKELDKIAEVMKKFPDVEVELSAHTDSRGNDNFNLQLSALRANACVEYLASKGVDKTKIIAIGFGEMKIRNKCINKVPCTEKEHSVNRRVEFKVVKFD